MNWIALLIIIEMILFIIAMMIFQCDILAPSVIVCLVFLASTIILATNTLEWGVCISLSTVLVITVALVSFIFIGYFVFKSTSKKLNNKGITIPTIQISNVKIVISLIFEGIICILYYKEVVRIASYVTQSWGMGLIWKYRQMAFYTDNLTKDQMMSTWVTQGYKLTMIIAYIMLYVFVNNVIVNKKKVKNNIKYILPVPAYLFMVILAGNRLAIMNMVFFAVMVWYVLNTLKRGFSIKKSMRYIFKLVVVAVAVIIIFWLMTSVVQRFTKLPFWNTLSIYAGASIQLLDNYLLQPVEDNLFFGQESLINIYNSLYKLGLTDYHGINNLEYRTINGISLGNVYTTIRRFVQDFGIAGMPFAIAFVSLFYNWFYYLKVKRIKNINFSSSMNIILYSFMVYPLFLFSIEEYFTLMWSFGYLLTLLLFYLVFIFYTRVTIRKTKIILKKW